MVINSTKGVNFFILIVGQISCSIKNKKYGIIIGMCGIENNLMHWLFVLHLTAGSPCWRGRREEQETQKRGMSSHFLCKAFIWTTNFKSFSFCYFNLSIPLALLYHLYLHLFSALFHNWSFHFYACLLLFSFYPFLFLLSFLVNAPSR